MINFLSAVGTRLSLAMERTARERARRELLRLDPRLLNDAGLSRELLHEGVGSWPWRLKDEIDMLEAARQTKQQAKIQKKAIRDLRAMSDAELADLAIVRGDIERVVRNGRRDYEKDVPMHKQAA